MTLPRIVEMRLDEWPMQALEAALEFRPPQAEALRDVPPLWHWLYFLRTARRSQMGVDGHPADPDLVDPADPRRRMFASARVHFERPLELGHTASMRESILRTRDTQGRAGPLRIVTFEYQYHQHGELCIREERDIVYLPGAAGANAGGAAGANAAGANAGGAAGANAAGTGGAEPPTGSITVFTPDPVLLFRFSALTFNAHRIHYDQRYAQETEGYRERIVHGPLIAILLAELLRGRELGRPRRFEFRAQQPLFVNEPIRLSCTTAGDQITLRAVNPSGAIAMEAHAWM